MAAPHDISLTKVGFNSKTRTVTGFGLNVAAIDVYDNTAELPMGGILAPVAGPAHASCRFTTRMNPSGSSGGAKTPPDGLLWQGCGFTEAINGTTDTKYTLADPPVYTAVDLETSIGNLYAQNCSNAVGTVTMRFDGSTSCMTDWTFGGTYTTPSEAAIADALSNGGAAPKAVGTITVNSDSLVMKRASIAVNAGNTGTNYDISGTNGVANPVGTTQYPIFDCAVQLPAFATANYITDLTTIGGTLAPISMVFGTGAGFVITVTMKGYLIGVPAFSNIGGVLNARLVYRMDRASGSPLIVAYT